MKGITAKLFSYLGLMAGAQALFVLATAGTTLAATTITKSFEFGPGTANAVSNKRTFNIPCGVRVYADVEHYRLGATGAANDVPIIMELKKPGTTADVEGPVAETRAATARRDKQIVRFVGTESNLGCSLPWVVRVKPASGTSPFAIKGTIALTYDNSVNNISVEGGLISLNKGNQVTKNVGGSSGLSQGTVVITATWLHAIGVVPGPNPVQLKFELINPGGRVVAQATGYANNEINPCCSGNKMRIVFKVTECTGQWKLRITNNTNHDTMNIDPRVALTPNCL